MITKDKGFNAPEGVRVFSSPEAVVKAAKEMDVAYVIGGAQIYEAFLPYVDVMHITEVIMNLMEMLIFLNSMRQLSLLPLL